jgi:bacterioferritin-associated ferredoxin
MYVCLCNGITDSALRACADNGECSVVQAYRALGCEPQCCKCLPFARQVLRQAVQAAQIEVGGDD